MNEFVEMTKGILSNVALEGLAALRDDVPRVLAKFDSSLDSAYLGHRILLPNPADAEDHVVEALEVWPESHWPGFALREADVFKTYMAWWCM